MNDYKKIFNIAFINLFLVIIGYFLTGRLGQGILPLSKFIRISFLLYSFYVLNKIVPFRTIRDNYSSRNLFTVFLILILVSSVLANYPMYVLSKLLVSIPSVMFTIVFINTAFSKLGLETTKILLLRLFISCFSIPLFFSIVFNGNYYLGKNLYGIEWNVTADNYTNDGFLSNHLAWSSIIVFSSSIAYLGITKLTKSKKIVLYFLMLFSVMTIINSGSRTILVALIVYFIVLLIKNILLRSNLIKPLALTFFLIFVLSKINLHNLESVKSLIFRTNVHLYNQENFARFSYLASGLKVFDENPITYLIGIGLFNKKAISDMNITFFSGHRGTRNVSNFHNSYADILFGGGIIVFLIFVYLALLKSLRQLWKYNDKYFLLVIPLHLIALTESSLQGGQFIFYPLFYFICVSNLKCLNVSSKIKPI